MSRSQSFRITTLLLLATLQVSPAFAGDRERSQPTKEPGSVAAFLWQALDELLSMFGASSGTMDPDGRPLPPQSGTTSEGDSSGTMDPDG